MVISWFHRFPIPIVALLFSGIVAGALLSGALITSAGAHKGAMGVVKLRMDDMKSLGDTMKALKAVAVRSRAFDAKLVAAAANHIETVAKRLPERFPKGTNAKPSEALDVIWTDWPAFTTISKDMATAAAALGKAGSYDAFRQRFSAVGATCRSCHKKYRLDK